MYPDSIRAKAVLLGDRIDLRRIHLEQPLRTAPLCFGVGEQGRFAMFRYGSSGTSSS
jgi:hypothetical protein